MAAITIAALIEYKEESFVFGSAHEHASISIIILGDEFDLSKPKFQLQSPFIHLENNNGYVIHRHSEHVTLGYLFDTLNLKISQDCFVNPKGSKFCSNDDYSLKLYINENRVDDIQDYIIWDGDFILIAYGDYSEEQIEQYFTQQKLRGFPFEIPDKTKNYLSKV